MATNEQPSKPLKLVILPGLLCDSRMFQGQLAEFANLSVVDGFYGKAGRIEDMAAYALARMPERCVLVGHSMGARVALEVWRQAPGRVAGLVLSNTGVHPVKPGEREKRHALLDLGRRQGIEALVAQWLPPMIGRLHRDDGELAGMLTAMCEDAGVATYAAQIEALLHRPALEDLLPAIDCPALSIVGSDDEWSPPAQHQEIAEAIPGCALRVIEGAGHMLPAERPAAFNAGIRQWLESHAEFN